MGDVMEIMYFSKKGTHIDTVEKFFICAETKKKGRQQNVLTTSEIVPVCYYIVLMLDWQEINAVMSSVACIFPEMIQPTKSNLM